MNFNFFQALVIASATVVLVIVFVLFVRFIIRTNRDIRKLDEWVEDLERDFKRERNR